MTYAKNLQSIEFSRLLTKRNNLCMSVNYYDNLCFSKFVDPIFNKIISLMNKIY